MQHAAPLGPVIALTSPQEVFRGQVLRSTQHKVAIDHLGKKVAVIGSCTSGIWVLHLLIFSANTLHTAHDICSDYADHGIGK